MYGIEERWLNTEGAIAKIKDAIANAEPFSLIRIQDGEYRFIEYENVPLTDLEQIIWVHFGRQPFPDRYVKFISQGVIKAAQNASIVGLFRGPLVLSPQHGEYQRLLYSAVSRQLINENANVVDADIHNTLLVEQAYEQFLTGLPFLGLVTCRHIAAAVGKKFGIGEVRTYMIPEQHQFASNLLDFYNNKPHFPDAFAETCRNIHVPFKGAVFLVGAGMLGKIYCDEIKKKGGIAIDVGSVFDAWDGVYSRAQFARGYPFNEINPIFRIRDRREMLPPASKISHALKVGRDEAGQLALQPFPDDTLSPDKLIGPELYNIGLGPVGGSHKIEFGNKGELTQALAQYPYGASLVRGETPFELQTAEEPLVNKQGDLSLIDNVWLQGKLDAGLSDSVSGTVYASAEFTDSLKAFDDDGHFFQPTKLPIDLSTGEFWLYCDYEVTRPVKGNEFATAVSVQLDDQATTLVIRSGLNNAAQAAIIYGPEHALDFVRYDFGAVRRHKVLISLQANYVVAASNGHLFQPKYTVVQRPKAATLTVGSYPTGAHILGGRIFGLAVGNGPLSAEDMIRLTV